MNIGIQTPDELILFYTDKDMERAKNVCKEANIEVEDMFEVKDDDIQYHCWDSRVRDTDKVLECEK